MKDDATFWNDIKKISISCSTVLSHMVDGVTGEKSIAGMWEKHCDLRNSNKDTSYQKQVLNSIKYIPSKCDIIFDVSNMCEAIKYFTFGKSPGLANIQTEHYKYAAPVIQVQVCLLW